MRETDVKGKVVYLSGPMTGWEDYNKAAFDDAARKLRDMGAEGVFNPADSLPRFAIGWRREHFMLDDLDMLTMTVRDKGSIRPVFDVLVLLPFWWTSKGSRLERRIAEQIGVKVVRLRDCV